MTGNDPVLIVIPTYDEADSILTVLDRVRRAAPRADVLVVDDLSPDGTADLVRRYAGTDPAVHLLSGSGKNGLGTAYRTGFRWALDRGYAAVAQMDADLSHPPERVPALLASLQDHDVVVGSRYVAGGEVRDWPWSRRLLSRGGNAYARLVLGLPVHDVTAGFKAFRRDALLTIGALDSVSDGYCFQIENTWRAARSGLRIAEVPITFVDRTAGESKMSARIALEAMRRVLAWRWDSLRAPLLEDVTRAHRPAGPAGQPHVVA